MARDHHHGQRLVEGVELPQHLHAVHARHLDVEQHEVGALALHRGEAFLAAGGADELVVLVFENHPQRFADGALVVDDQDARLHGQRVAGAAPTGAGAGTASSIRTVESRRSSTLGL